MTIVEPFHLGPQDRLFGVLDAPARPRAGAWAVLICQPVGHEHVWCHRACRRLAARLAEAGHVVLRFDATGCGDAPGDDAEGSLARWCDDVDAALGVVRERAADHLIPADRVAVVGLRLGAAVAALAGARRGDVERMVLWEPVVRGAAHLSALRALHLRHAAALGVVTGESAPGRVEEVLGFVLSPALVGELEQLDLCALEAAPARRVLALSSGASDAGDLAARLRVHGTVEEARVDEEGAWIVEPFRMAMPARGIEAVEAWLAREDP